MDWEKLAFQLKQILGSSVVVRNISMEEWKQASEGQMNQVLVKEVELEGSLNFFLESSASSTQQVLVMTLENTELKPLERSLVELAIEAARVAEKPKSGSPTAEEERRSLLVRDWFNHQIEMGNTNTELTEPLASQLGFYKARIPFLLNGEFSGANQVSYQDLKKLLESFFDTEINLIPLMDKEWLILAPETLLLESYGEGDTEETEEDALTALTEGLYEMLSNEWLGECHLSVHYPVTPAKSLLSAALSLRETILLGKAFHVGTNIHLPWQQHMEKLLYAIPDEEKNLFINQVFKRNDPVLEGETLSTLESFFHLECNVSETAKKLYIHRNTLLYRLDKFKQETGLDVRSFNDAVLIRIAVLLYKFTKRQ
ncbi:MAG: helix-turn-helix domain-containing protein [Gorillibacterium sp.]|nr:helix-turn-helix domain-containing protein [Gorillibacterium sp.]